MEFHRKLRAYLLNFTRVIPINLFLHYDQTVSAYVFTRTGTDVSVSKVLRSDPFSIALQSRLTPQLAPHSLPSV